jgi:hypothetical protein
MKDTKILIPAIVNSYRPLRDKSWSISLNINEPNSEQKVIIDKLFQQPCYVLIKDSEIKTEDQVLVDSLNVMPVKGKSKSQELRQKIWKVWKNNFEDSMTEKEYYEQEMDKLINHYDKK